MSSLFICHFLDFPLFLATIFQLWTRRMSPSVDMGTFLSHIGVLKDLCYFFITLVVECPVEFQWREFLTGSRWQLSNMHFNSGLCYVVAMEELWCFHGNTLLVR